MAQKQHKSHADCNPKTDKTDHSAHEATMILVFVVLYADLLKRISHKRVSFFGIILYNNIIMRFSVQFSM